MVVQLSRKQLPESWFREQVKGGLLPAGSVLCEFVGMPRTRLDLNSAPFRGSIPRSRPLAGR